MHHLLPFYEHIEDWLKSARENSGLRPPGWPIFLLGFFIFLDGFLFFPWHVGRAFELALFLMPLWLPLLVLESAWTLWIIMIRSYFIAAQSYVLLEIKPPRSLAKTPLAMEAVLAGFWHYPGESDWWRLYRLGRVRPWWSLEMVSLEGQVHFYVWTRANFRKLVEAAFYAQYPGVQVVEAVDYTRTITADPGAEWMVWGADFKHTKPDPYPIKTYIEYGLDKVQEENEQVDPMSNLIEFLGQMGKGEYFWLQFVIRVHKGEKYGSHTNKDGKPYTWLDEAAEIVQEIRSKTRESYIDIVSGEERPGFPNPTKQQIETMAAIERNVSKLPFDIGIRSIYIAKPKNFDPINITGIIGLFRAFSSIGWNEIRANRWLMEYNDYPWELGNDRRKERRAKELVEAYRRRQHFHEPFEFHDTMVMSTEEIATLFHIPSRAVESPAVQRIDSSTGTAPVNLPT
jgi:hypothetical protein